ncbi:MAG: DUF362 domain-containing protein [Clostridiales bacterium]|jgi:uncharacterized Fe-S center protein|nr:DUF362 domain-containing protein [Clostridiales bacterium]
MKTEVLFSSVNFDRYDKSETLPEKFKSLLDRLELEDKVTDKLTAIKMHVGRGIGYSTIHPLFVKILIDKLKSCGARVYVTDQTVTDSKVRGYTEEYLGVPIVPVCGVTDKYYYEKSVDFNSFKNVDIGGNIYDADVMINLSHVKGHGACGYGGACKNIAMGCVTDRTRSQIHGLEGGLEWDESKCIHCDACVSNCGHNANKFVDGKYTVFFHNCTYCGHCVKVCPTGAITLNDNKFEDFQTGMAICTKQVLDTFEAGNVFYINFLMNITALCDCWGMTTPAIVPDIGIMASKNIVAIERACLDKIRNEDFLPSGVPVGHKLLDAGHLFYRIHGKDPFIQLNELEKQGLGSQSYILREIG